MTDSLPAPVAACPSCGATLVHDGQEHICSRCGRAFAVTDVAASGAGVYRPAPMLVVPAAQKPAPFVIHAPQWIEPGGMGRLWKLVRGGARGEDAPLDVKFGGARVLMGFIIAGGPLWVVLSFFGSTSWMLLPIWGLVLLAARTKRPADQIFERDGWLFWKRLYQDKVQSVASAELTSVVGVHDEGDHVRVVLEDGHSWEIGKGIKMSRRVSRWLARRIAQRIPPMAERQLAGAVERAPGALASAIQSPPPLERLLAEALEHEGEPGRVVIESPERFADGAEHESDGRYTIDPREWDRVGSSVTAPTLSGDPGSGWKLEFSSVLPRTEKQATLSRHRYCFRPDLRIIDARTESLSHRIFKRRRRILT